MNYRELTAEERERYADCIAQYAPQFEPFVIIDGNGQEWLVWRRPTKDRA